MRWWRHCTLARTVAAALLLWTAADLTNASLCALDSNHAITAASAAATPALEAGDSPTGESSSPSPHVDDCFCCSHCVDVEALTPPVFTERTVRLEPLPDLARTVGFGFPLYHPPLV